MDVFGVVNFFAFLNKTEVNLCAWVLLPQDIWIRAFTGWGRVVYCRGYFSIDFCVLRYSVAFVLVFLTWAFSFVGLDQRC